MKKRLFGLFTTGLAVVLGVELHTQMEQASLLNALHANVFEEDIARPVLVSHHHGHTSLIGDIVLILFQYINLSERQVLHYLSLWGIGVSMSTHIDGMGNICPEHGMLHRDVS